MHNSCLKQFFYPANAQATPFTFTSLPLKEKQLFRTIR